MHRVKDKKFFCTNRGAPQALKIGIQHRKDVATSKGLTTGTYTDEFFFCIILGALQTQKFSRQHRKEWEHFAVIYNIIYRK